jgi:hypothetical protein
MDYGQEGLKNSSNNWDDIFSVSMNTPLLKVDIFTLKIQSVLHKKILKILVELKTVLALFVTIPTPKLD